MTTQELAAAAGVSVRQVHHWCLRGWMGRAHQGRGIGYDHEFGPADVERARALGAASALKAMRLPDLAARLVAEAAPGCSCPMGSCTCSEADLAEAVG